MAKRLPEDLRLAKDSLDDIMKRIGPFKPKPPKAREKEEKKWRVVIEATFPPTPSEPCSKPKGMLGVSEFRP